MHSIVRQRAHGLRRALTAGCAVIGFMAAGAALAQNFPSKPLTFVVPYSPGAPGGDLLFRAITTEAGKIIGQPFVVENRAGAAGKLGLQAVLKAKGDPYVVGLADNGMITVQPLRDPEIAVEPGRDYTPVQISVQSLELFVANPSAPFRDIKGMIAYAKANPGKLNVSITSLGGIGHLSLLKFADRVGVEFNVVPYKSEPESVQAIVQGDVQASLMSGGGIKPHVDAGRALALATSGLERWSRFPTAPTVSESVVPGWTSGFWLSVISPADIPGDALNKIYGAYNAALKTPEVIKRLSDIGFLTIGSTPQEMMQRVKADLIAYGPIVKKLQAKIN